MFTVSEPLAGFLFNWANVFVAVGAALGLIGVLGIFAMGAAKEQFSNERVASNEASTALANADAEKAKAEAAAARLALEQYKAPRTLSAVQMETLATELKTFAGQRFILVSYKDVKEAIEFEGSLRTALSRAGWIDGGKYGLGLAGGTVGVYVDFDGKDEKVSAAANAVASALQGFGIEAIARIPEELFGPHNDSKTVGIEIGTKH